MTRREPREGGALIPQPCRLSYGEGAGTMVNRFEDLWKSAGDGAFSPVGTIQPDCDTDALMDAWFRERQDSIECRLYLEEAQRLLRQVVMVGKVPPRLRKQAKTLLRAVRE